MISYFYFNLAIHIEITAINMKLKVSGAPTFMLTVWAQGDVNGNGKEMFEYRV